MDSCRWELELTHQLKLRILYSTLIGLGLLAILSLPLGFDQHHSGLMLSTLNEFDEAMTSDKEYPFNQYGPGWILVFHIALILAPANYLFLAVKGIGFFLILLSLVATYTLARSFLDRFGSLVAVGFVLLTYPFFSGFLPWPSLVVMPIIPYITSVFVKFTLADIGNPPPSKVEFFCVGFLLGITLLTRAQIGIALILAIFLLFISFGWTRARISIYLTVVGFVFNLCLIMGFLFFKGWLVSALYDQFVLGFMYVIGDKSTFPIPIGTIILVTTLLFAYASTQLKARFSRVQNLLIKTFSPLVSALIVLFVTILVINSVRVFNRLWIALVIATLIICFVKCFRGMHNVGDLFRNPLSVLTLFSAVALLQIWPLFDQMHTWWAITPISVLVILILKGSIFNRELPKTLVSAFIISIILITSNHALTVYRTFTSSSEIPIQGLALNYSFNANVEELVLINNYFNANIPQNSSVLNLCSNANAFFDANVFNSASRNIVFWSPMKDNRDLIQDIENSTPTYIIACDFTPFSSQLYNYDTLQDQMTKSVFKKSEIKSVLSLSDSRKVSILVRNESNADDL